MTSEVLALAILAAVARSAVGDSAGEEWFHHPGYSGGGVVRPPVVVHHPIGWHQPGWHQPGYRRDPKGGLVMYLSCAIAKRQDSF